MSFVVASADGTPVDVDAGGSLDLALEVDLSDPVAPRIFLGGSTAVTYDLLASEEALAFDAPFGVLAATIAGGVLTLDRDGAGPGEESVLYQVSLPTGAATYSASASCSGKC